MFPAGPNESPTSASQTTEQAYDRFAAIYDRWNSANDYELWLGGYLIPVLQRHNLRRGSVLDIGCGTGRAFEPLLRRRWRVVGCDVSWNMLTVAKENFGDRVPLFKADARELPTDLAIQYAPSSAGFDLVLMLNDVVNYVTKEGELDRVFAGIRRNLRSAGGLLLFDANSLCLFERDYLVSVRERWETGWEWQGLSEVVAPGGVFQGRISGPGVESHLHTQRHWTVAHVEGALSRSRLELKAVMGQRESAGRLSLTESPDETTDEKIIFIAAPE